MYPLKIIKNPPSDFPLLLFLCSYLLTLLTYIHSSEIWGGGEELKKNPNFVFNFMSFGSRGGLRFQKKKKKRKGRIKKKRKRQMPPIVTGVNARDDIYIGLIEKPPNYNVC